MLEEVEQILKKYSPKQKQQSYFEPVSYMGTGFFMLGLTVPQQREIFKKGYSFSSLPPDEQFIIWDKIWNDSQIFEVLTQAMFFPEKNAKKLDQKKLLETFKKWIKKIDNWGHSDMMSSIIAKMLVKEADIIFPQLQKWNRSKNSWEKRQSVVSLAMYHRRNNALDYSAVISLVKNLLEDDHYFVQKGVGWSLREIGTQYPKEVWKFLNENVNSISPIAFSATIEKLDASKKEALKKIRKKGR
jgi:3-methyladenine DNA glycosylase AlkD